MNDYVVAELLENLRAIRADLAKIKTHLTALAQTDLNRDGGVAEIAGRVERIERRLELNGQ